MLNDGKLFGKFAFGINICKAKNINIIVKKKVAKDRDIAIP